jgi:hypothetical protein
VNGQSASVSIFAPSGVNIPIYLTYQNRQLGASTGTALTNNQMWMIPFRVAGGSVSGSSIQFLQSITGNITSAATAQFGQTMRWCIYSNNTTNSTRFDTWKSGSLTWQVYRSGSSTGSWAFNGSTSSSINSSIFTQVFGMRMYNMALGTTVDPGLYVMAFAASTSSANNSNIVSTTQFVMDNPMPLAMGNNFGAATATSIGYVDAGTYSVTSTAFPSSIGISEIRQHSNLVPYFKIGAI